MPGFTGESESQDMRDVSYKAIGSNIPLGAARPPAPDLLISTPAIDNARHSNERDTSLRRQSRIQTFTHHCHEARDCMNSLERSQEYRTRDHDHPARCPSRTDLEQALAGALALFRAKIATTKVHLQARWPQMPDPSSIKIGVEILRNDQVFRRHSCSVSSSEVTPTEQDAEQSQHSNTNRPQFILAFRMRPIEQSHHNYSNEHQAQKFPPHTSARDLSPTQDSPIPPPPPTAYDLLRYNYDIYMKYADLPKGEGFFNGHNSKITPSKYGSDSRHDLGLCFSTFLTRYRCKMGLHCPW
ncbi:hypothetical protein COCCADRAFT_1283 [Bipolaris zeicola 26-R-13]|uniref:Uncharacterized protein n=1 Tax=Cochliobolus carbonum (strain 26-R-13) TaxID=930089 RepID=W6Z2D5_COCC2|nr:uncharacterized protein COCCADRAFT_1283 [Bipolaris zeicola 26-R-13]EUC37836.1 hypothetical protein COCCADRAFT_1283 [Bipolaris zeicola 26-R-13]